MLETQAIHKKVRTFIEDFAGRINEFSKTKKPGTAK